MEVLRANVVKSSWLQIQYATALAASTIALLAFCLIYVMSRRIESLERNIHDLSLRDELTGLYNRRGFYVLATQALRLAQRLDALYSVIFIDMDNLKQVNDTYGHEIGSELLKEMAAILTTNFREIDIIGRLGGDEFVVAVNAGPVDLAMVIQRLESATTRANKPPRPFLHHQLQLRPRNLKLPQTPDPRRTPQRRRLPHVPHQTRKTKAHRNHRSRTRVALTKPKELAVRLP